jgi:hypothetical protein
MIQKFKYLIEFWKRKFRNFAFFFFEKIYNKIEK